MEEIINIQETEKQHKDEWLLFEIVESDRLNQPLKGRLLFHSKSRDEIHKEAMKHREKLHYITFCGDPVEQGTIAIL